jgi:hypothetical protein
VVTADGRLLHASRDENPDLFWGLRGGGGNFGVATSLEYRLEPIASEVQAGPIFYALDDAPVPFRAFREGALEAPDDVGSAAAMVTSPEGVPLAALIVCHSGAGEAGQAAVRSFRAAGSPVADAVGPMPYQAVQTMFDAAFPAGRRNYWKSGFLRSIDDDAVAILADWFRRAPNPSAGIFVEAFGGAVARTDPAESAFSHRSEPYSIIIFSGWDDPAEDAANMGWARGLWSALRPFAADGVYVNYLGREADEDGDRVRSAYGASWERLVALKRAYDPDNLFRVNQTVAPA